MVTITKPCTQCGECCKAEACVIANAFGIFEAPCKALEYEGGKYWCGLTRNLKRYIDLGPEPWRYEVLQDYLKGIMKFGLGCDSY